jgi:hypothetical protein
MSIILDGSEGITQEGKFNSNSTFGLRNRIFNGDMRIDQRNAGASVTVNQTAAFYGVDRWLAGGITSDGVFTIQRDTSVPAGFINSTKVTVTTADASIGASQVYNFQQRIEGLNVADLGWGTANAKTVTLSFWVRSSLTGTFSGSILNSAQNYSYPFSYSISSADTWENKTVTISGPTAGTWLTDNGIGLIVLFSVGAGSSVSGTAGAWSASGLYGVTGAVNVIGTLDATWYVTGVQLEAGSVATPFERRPFGTELNLCYRYYYRISPSATARILGLGWNFSTTVSQITTTFPVPMRTNPSALEQSGTASHYRVDHTNTFTNCSSVPVLDGGSTNYLSIASFIVSSGLTAGQAAAGQTNNTAAYLGWSAEL